jgi:hypothetical protein
MTLRARLTHHYIGDNKQIVLEDVGLVQEKYPTLKMDGSGPVRRFKPSPNDSLFADPSAKHIFLNVSGLTREAAIVFDATKTYDIVISEVPDEPVVLPAPITPIAESEVPVAVTVSDQPPHTG